MMDLVVHPEAEKDLLEAYQWYEQHRSGLGSEFLSGVGKTLQSIQSNPELSTPVFKNIRRTLMKNFPFGIYYFIYESTISILAVMHAKRAPRHWKKRK